MTNQQPLDYIKKQLLEGVSREHIKNTLMINGWLAEDMEEGFNSSNPPVLLEQNATISAKSPMAAWKPLVAILIGVAVIGSDAYSATRTLFKSEQAPEVSNEVSDQLPTNKPTESIAQSEQPAEQTESQDPELVFADKLSSCTKYKTKFVHPFTGETLEKEILGIINDRCEYVEQMPGGGKMECKYTESEREAVAQYYKDVASAESLGTGVKIKLGSGEQTAKYTINGKEVENPLQEAMNSGACVISGY